MRVHVDPNTDASGFGYVAASEQQLRVLKCEHIEGANYPYLKWEFELTDPNLPCVAGEAKAGHIFENTTLKTGENSQFGLKRVCDALGLDWGEFDTDEVTGMEFQAVLGIKEYEGNFSNIVKKFISAK